MIKFYTAGESHGEAIFGFLEGLPSGLDINEKFIANELERRRKGFGRSTRQKDENDEFLILTGVENGKTTGAPITIEIENKKRGERKPLFVPRPGHADFAGAIKFKLDDFSIIAERASGRETAARVAIGAIAKLYLTKLDIIITSFVHQIGNVKLQTNPFPLTKKELEKEILIELINKTDKSYLRCPDPGIDKKMKQYIEKVIKKGDSAGGAFTVIAYNLPVGLGSHLQWNQKLDAQLSSALMSIQGIKGIEFGTGFEGVSKSGSMFHDAIYYDNDYYRKTNRAGGIEGGMTNGEPIVIKCAVKPPSSIGKPLSSVNFKTKEPAFAESIRSDSCFVPAAGIVSEAMLSLILLKHIVV